MMRDRGHGENWGLRQGMRFMMGNKVYDGEQSSLCRIEFIT